MTHTPPIDQRIVDEYFRLVSNRKTKAIAWLYGMIATYGLKPEELDGSTWGPEFSICVKSRKRPVKPCHPQWTFLFSLQEKQPCEVQSCRTSLYEAMAYQDISLNVTDLLLAYRLRKKSYSLIKQPSTPAYAGVS